MNMIFMNMLIIFRERVHRDGKAMNMIFMNMTLKTKMKIKD